MSGYNKILYSINEYDRDGDCSDEGVFLHFDNTRVKVCDKAEDFPEIVSQINNIWNEIKKEAAE